MFQAPPGHAAANRDTSSSRSLSPGPDPGGRSAREAAQEATTFSFSTTSRRLEVLGEEEAREAVAVGRGDTTPRSRLKEGAVAPRALAALSSSALMVVGFRAWTGGLAVDFFSWRPKTCLASNPVEAGRGDGVTPDPRRLLVPAPEVGEGTGGEGKGTSPSPGSDEDGEVDTKGIPAETAKEEKKSQQITYQIKAVEREIESFTR